MKYNKFRVWNKKRKEMLYSPNYLLSSDGLLWWHFGYEEIELLDLDDYEVMLYTEKNDKNNKAIYEGDVVKILREDNCFGKGDFEEIVIVQKSEYSELSDRESGGPEGSSPIKKIEIIGNKHENPELSEGWWWK